MKASDIHAVWPQWEPMGPLGEGRYGKVTLCRGKQDGQDVYCAVKIIEVPPNDSATAAARAQGINEDMLKQYFGKLRDDLNWELSMYHPAAGGSLAPVEDCLFEENDGVPGWRAYIRTGVYTPLASYFGKNRPTEGDAVRMGIQLLQGLEQLQRFGLIHGEITTENVMVTDAGDFVLTDFGIRRCLDKAGAGLFPSSASGFDAPEVSSYNHLSSASDIYSVGMVLASVLNGGVLPKNGNLPKGALSDVLKKATAFNPNERYQTPAQMRADLEKLNVAPGTVRRAAAVMTAMDTIQRLSKAQTPVQERKLNNTSNGTSTVTAAASNLDRLKENNHKRDTEETKKRRTSGLIQAACVVLIFLAIAAVLAVYRPWERLRPNEQNANRNSDVDQLNEADGQGNQQNEGNGDSEQITVPGADDLILQGKGNDSSTDTQDPQTTQEGTVTTTEGEGTEPTDNTKEGETEETGENGETQSPKQAEETTGNTEETASSPSDKATGTITGSGVRFRTEPNGNCTVIQLLNKGDEVEVKELVNNYWYHVIYNGKDGYVSKEYLKLTEGASVDNTTAANTTNTNKSSNTYILPSDSKYLTNDDLKDLTRDQTYMALNEIYARHGKIFTTKSVQEYFESQSWYKAVTKDSSYCAARFNEYEKANWNLIIQYQKDKGYR